MPIPFSVRGEVDVVADTPSIVIVFPDIRLMLLPFLPPEMKSVTVPPPMFFVEPEAEMKGTSCSLTCAN